MLNLGLPEIVAAVMMLALNAYVLTGGADFGGGIWELLAFGPRREAQRKLVSSAIGPIWEANHVWLIIAIVVLFTAFPDAYATLSTVLHIPLTLMLAGVVMRGSAFVFRSYGSRDDAGRRRWGQVFAIASLVTPVLLGVIVGAIASGATGQAATLLASAPKSVSFHDAYVASWLSPFPLAVGVLALTLFAFLASVYLTVAATDPLLQEDFRRRALVAGVAVFVMAFGALLIAREEAPEMGYALTRANGATLFHTATGIAASIALLGLWKREFHLARVAAALQVSLVLWGWVLGQYPLVIPPSRTLRMMAAPDATLVLLLWALAAGGVLLLPSLVYLFRTFARAQDEDS